MPFNILSITSFSQKCSKNCVVFFQLYSIVWQNCELHERIAGREWLRSTNFYLSTKSRHWNGGHFRFQIHTTCGRMEFRFSELRRVYIHRFACFGRFYHWHRAGECSLLENCSPLYENAQVPWTSHRDAVSASNELRCDGRIFECQLTVSRNYETQVWSFRCKWSKVFGSLRLIISFLLSMFNFALQKLK